MMELTRYDILGLVRIRGSKMAKKRKSTYSRMTDAAAAGMDAAVSMVTRKKKRKSKKAKKAKKATKATKAKKAKKRK